MICTVFDAAQYILDKMGAMSAMKLQKLLFYSQAMALVWDDIPIFNEDFQAWAKGPVCPELYEMHKGMFMISDGKFMECKHPNADKLMKDHRDTIDTVLKSIGELSPFELSEMTHKESPWIDARSGVPNGARCEVIITKESMCNYYSENW